MSKAQKGENKSSHKVKAHHKPALINCYFSKDSKTKTYDVILVKTVLNFRREKKTPPQVNQVFALKNKLIKATNSVFCEFCESS